MYKWLEFPRLPLTRAFLFGSIKHGLGFSAILALERRGATTKRSDPQSDPSIKVVQVGWVPAAAWSVGCVSSGECLRRFCMR